MKLGKRVHEGNDPKNAPRNEDLRHWKIINTQTAKRGRWVDKLPKYMGEKTGHQEQTLGDLQREKCIPQRK